MIPACILRGAAIAPIILLISFSSIVIQRVSYSDIRKKFKDNFPIILLFLWFAISNFWSINKSSGAIKTLEFAIAIIILFAISSPKNYISSVVFERYMKLLFFSILIAVVIFYIEYNSSGFIYYKINELFNLRHDFSLYRLEGGSKVIAVFSWPLIGYFIYKKRVILTIIYITIILTTLYIADNLASIVSFSLTIIAWCLLYFSRMRLISLILIGFIFSVIMMPILSYLQPVEYISDNYPIPLSAKHRLFIWKYTSELFFKNPIFGYGINSSQYFHEYTELNDISVDFMKNNWSLFHHHPHNNILQVALEGGIIGLLLFLFTIIWIINRIQLNKNLIYQVSAVTTSIAYYIISMVSMDIWRTWWVMVLLFAYFMIYCLKHIIQSHKRERYML